MELTILFRIRVYEDDGDMPYTPEQQILSTLAYDSPEVGAEIYRTDQVRAPGSSPETLFDKGRRARTGQL